MVLLELPEKLRLPCAGAGDDRPRSLGCLEEVERVPLSECLAIRDGQALGGVVLDGREHPEARVPGGALLAAEQAVVEERSQRVEIGGADGFDGVQGAATREHRQLLEEPPLGWGEQLVAPVDRCPEGLVPEGQVAGAAREQLERPRDPGQDLLGRQHPGARRREARSPAGSRRVASR